MKELSACHRIAHSFNLQRREVRCRAVICGRWKVADPDWNLRADSLLERSCRDLNVIAEGPRRQHGTGAPALTGALSYLCTTVCLQSSSLIPQGRAEY